MTHRALALVVLAIALGAISCESLTGTRPRAKVCRDTLSFRLDSLPNTLRLGGCL